MRINDIGLRFALCGALLSSLSALARRPASTLAGPDPPALLAAKKIFILNAEPDGRNLSRHLFAD